MKKAIPCLPVILFFCSSCGVFIKPAYYLSPLDINANYYHSIPLKSDSMKTASYGNMAIFSGIGNSVKIFGDHVYAFQSSFHRSHNLGNFQAYYGTGFALGSYDVTEYYRVHYATGTYNPFPTDTSYHIPSSNKFFGAYGFNGGLNFVHAFKKRKGEWRLGVETSLHNEFGKYLGFRRSLPDTAVSLLATYEWTKTIGGYMEWLWKRRRSGKIFGFKISGGTSIISSNTYKGIENSNSPFYFSGTFHVTNKNITWFSQLNSGLNTFTFQTGLNLQLGKKTKKRSAMTGG
jgi:hypothetical protein